MIAYQVPAVMRHLAPYQIFEEGATSFVAIGIFAYLSAVGKPVDPDVLDDLSQEPSSDIHDALTELEQLQLIEPVKIISDADEVAEVEGGAA